MKEARRVLRTSSGVGKYKVEMVLTLVGNDLIAVLSGGDRPHIGAVAVAIPRPSLKGSGRTSSTSSVFTLIAHKDDDVARMASDALARELNRVAVVSAGAHIDNASEADVRKLVQNADKAMKSAIKILKRDLKSRP